MMTQSVTSSKGRRWLTQLTPATTTGSLLPKQAGQFDGTQHLRQKQNDERIEVRKESKERPQTEAIYRQVHGIGTPAISTMSQLEIPTEENLEPGKKSHEIVFVNIPSFGENAQASATLDNLADAPATPAKDSTATKPQPATTADSVSGFAKAATAPKSSSGTDAAAANLSAAKIVGGEIGVLVDKIIDRFPLAAPTVLLFVGGEPNPNVEETCAQVASALAACHVGQVLLVDGDLGDHRLSTAAGMAHQTGLREIINRDDNWRSLIATQDSSSFSFLPAGTCPMDRWNSNELLRKMTAEMRQEYQFICIAAGDAHTKQARLWGEVCDGSYLIVSLKDSNETLAKSAIAELTASGARVLGCVVADA